MFTRPLSAVPAQRSSKAMLKVKLYSIVGAAALAALMGLLSFFAWIGFSPEVPEPEDLLPQGTAIAEIAARDFLAGRATSVPVAADVDPTFGASWLAGIEPGERKGISTTALTPLEFTRETLTSPEGTQTYELHSYLAATSGKLLQLDVTVLLTPEGPVLAAQPSLSPVSGPTSEYQPLDYRQFVSGSNAPSASEEVVAQVSAWANAYARDDAAGLRAVAGDETTTGDYVGLGGYQIAQAPRIVTTAPGTADDQLVLRVQLLLRDASAQEVQVSADYDLLVNAASTSLPKVVAWGPAGTPLLEPYMNNPNANRDTPPADAGTE